VVVTSSWVGRLGGRCSRLGLDRVCPRTLIDLRADERVVAVLSLVVEQALGRRHITVEVIRVPAGAVTGSFSLSVTAAAITYKAVPGLDGGAPNQDFALYVHNATQ
jgi:hypothetical protein